MAAPPEADVVEMVTWIEASEYKRAREVAFGVTSTITGLKGDVTGMQFALNIMKAEIAGLAIGVTAVKFDYTFFKVDEKGISWRGRQLVGWKYADAAKSFSAKIERNQRALGKAQKKLETKLDRFEKSQAKRKEALTDRDAAKRRLTSAQNRAAARPSVLNTSRVETAEKALRKAEKALERFDKKHDKAKKKAEKIRDWGVNLEKQIKKAGEGATEAKKKFDQATAAGTANLTKLKDALDNAARAA
ncbi:hypothetical protein ABZ725_01160 [Streptomyces sp. NPDC006872]|uniref:hypothetical protein n=1 Tax=Streptomyces sp. NPDC006872 TaxID=3155720 RepID=UPI0033E274A9